MKGRPPKPIERHIADGTLDVSRHARVPLVIGGREVPEPPRSDARFVEVWDETVGLLGPVLDRADMVMVESLVVRLIEARDAEAHVLEHGLIIDRHRVGRDGTAWVEPTENPAAAVARKARVEIRQLCDRLGIGPTARARLGNAGAQARSPEQDMDGLAEIVELRAVEG